MADLALYRKYRSGDFSEVVGQEHIVTTLTQALAAGRVSHAYLFTGPRGVGKTSVARLLARGLNPDVDAASAGLDIIEIDAASNRSIDAVRELRDKINLAPTVGKYKVYIIDEVHMLTTEAFNALLKTLEEPPAHAVFILATTESHKVPETIISRTQRFSFKPISVQDIIDRLIYIAAAEKITVEVPALELIATAARGSFRDGISLLDQVAAGGDTTVTLASVRDILGYSDAATIGALAQAVVEGRTKEVLTQLDRLTESGIQPGQIIAQLIEWWRTLLLVTVGTQVSTDPVVKSLATRVTLSTILAVIESLIEASRSPRPGLSLEVALVKLTTGPEQVAAPPVAPLATKTRVKAAGSSTTSPATSVTTPADDAMSDLWPKALMAIKTQNNSLYALLRSCRIEFTGGGIVIWSKFNFHRERIMEAKNRAVIDKSLEKVYGRPVPVLVQLDTAAKASRESTPANPSGDLVASALDILGGEIVE